MDLARRLQQQAQRTAQSSSPRGRTADHCNAIGHVILQVAFAE
jgi:hypothetical protein